MSSVMDWLMEGPAWMQYALQTGLGEVRDAAECQRLRQTAAADPSVRQLIAGLQDWPGSPLTSHKSAGHPLHQLVFLADLGLTIEDPGIATIAERVLAQAAAPGPFRVLMNIPAHFGGSGSDQLAWALCDAPLSLYALARFGLAGQPALQRAADFLTSLARPNGWPCAVSPELGRFRGPGRKEDPCPFANLIMLQALTVLPGYTGHPAARAGVEAALSAWANRRAAHPYMFFMGSDFCKLKAPLVWYDLLHVTDVLSRFPEAQKDPRFTDMLALLRQKADSQGRFTPESVWLSWKDWEFGQKKIPSRWLTFLAQRICSSMLRAGLPEPDNMDKIDQD